MPIRRGNPEQTKKQVFREFEAGQLHSGKGGPVVTNPKQAVAIALNQARKAAPRGTPKKTGRTKRGRP